MKYETQIYLINLCKERGVDEKKDSEIYSPAEPRMSSLVSWRTRPKTSGQAANMRRGSANICGSNRFSV